MEYLIGLINYQIIENSELNNEYRTNKITKISKYHMGQIEI